MILGLLAAAVIFLAYANGANDNFKGVATLFGSKTLSYKKSLVWATATTFAGSMAAVYLAGGLVKTFSGKGLVPEALAAQPEFLLAVALGAALTVIVATLAGIPISTTHALTGALVGAGLIATGFVNTSKLVERFFLPLAVSPLLSLAITGVLYPLFRRVRLSLNVEREMCLCVEGAAPQLVQIQPNGEAILRSTGVSLSVGQMQSCIQRYSGTLFGFDAQRILDAFHVASAAAVSFARGLNDTPKIVALLVAAQALKLPMNTALFAVALAMGMGGIFSAKKIAATMSEKITGMNHGQGFTANLTTSLLVLFASKFGMPVSTTHVSCGSLFGLGAVTGQARWKMVQTIALAWVATLPLAAGLAALVYKIVA